MSQMSSLPVLTTPDPTIFPRERQAAFLAALAASGNVRSASARVGISHQTAYRARLASPGFRRAWDAALLAARAQAEEILANRAIEGWEEDVLYHGEVVATRRRYSDRLLLAHLARLDKLCGDAEVAGFADSFDDALARYAAGEDRPARVVEVESEGEGDNSSSGQWSMRSTPSANAPELPPPLPAVRERGEVLGEAAQLDVGLYDTWWDEVGARWLTDWPLPAVLPAGEVWDGEEFWIDEDCAVLGPYDAAAAAPEVLGSPVKRYYARTLSAAETEGLEGAEVRAGAHRAARLELYRRNAFGLATPAEVASIAAANGE